MLCKYFFSRVNSNSLLLDIFLLFPWNTFITVLLVSWFLWQRKETFHDLSFTEGHYIKHQPFIQISENFSILGRATNQKTSISVQIFYSPIQWDSAIFILRSNIWPRQDPDIGSWEDCGALKLLPWSWKRNMSNHCHPPTQDGLWGQSGFERI